MADLKQITIPVLENGSITNKTYNLGGGGDAVGSFYGTCSTAAATAAKVASIPGEFKLSVGTLITIKFTNTNTASNPTLNVNGTGAKSIYYSTAIITTGSLSYAGSANRVITYLYDGTKWVFVSWGVDSNTTYTPATLGGGYGKCSTAASTTAKVATLSSYALVTGGMVTVKFTYAVPANATLNINSKGAKTIKYRNSNITANIIKAGDVATFIYDGSYYHLINIDDVVDNDGVTSFNGRTGAITPTAGDYEAKQINYNNSDSGLSSTTVRGAIDEVSTKISGYWTSTVNALVGDTTVTITDSAIKTTSVVEAYSQNASGSVTPIDGITVTNGQAVIRMPALTEATSFKLWIDENKAPSMTSAVVLWENTNVASSFAGQTVTLSDDIESYDYYEVVAQLQAGTGSTAMITFTSGLVPYDRNTQIRSFTAERYFAFNGNQCAVGNGIYYSTYGQAGTTDNSRIIPVKIIGFKFS